MLNNYALIIKSLFISYVLMGHFAISKLIVVLSTQSRPTLIYSVAYIFILCILISIKIFTGKRIVYFSPIMSILLILSMVILINNPYTSQSTDKLLFFLSLVFLPCFYLYLCNIQEIKLDYVFFFCCLFSIVILSTASFYYFSGGRFRDILVDKEQYSKLFSIGIAQYLVWGCFFYYYFAKRVTLNFFHRVTAAVLLLMTFAFLLFLGERQAIIAALGAPLIFKVIKRKSPKHVFISLITIGTIVILLLGSFMPYILKEGPLRNTKMGELLTAKYYNQNNIETLNGRTILYKMAIITFTENPFLGVGFSCFGEYVTNKYHLRLIKKDFDPHNLWLLISSELGVIGLIIAVSILLSFVRSIWVCSRSGSSASELLSMLGISVLLFTIVSISWRSSFILFSVAIILERYNSVRVHTS